jgi:hypothetical protein
MLTVREFGERLYRGGSDLGQAIVELCDVADESKAEALDEIAEIMGFAEGGARYTPGDVANDVEALSIAMEKIRAQLDGLEDASYAMIAESVEKRIGERREADDALAETVCDLGGWKFGYNVNGNSDAADVAKAAAGLLQRLADDLAAVRLERDQLAAVNDAARAAFGDGPAA